MNLFRISLCLSGLAGFAFTTAAHEGHHHGPVSAQALAALVAPENLTDSAEDREIRRWQSRHESEAGAATTTWGRLGWAYIAKGRTTFDERYFTLAARLAEDWETRHGRSDATRLLRGHAVLQLHRFAEAEAIARELTATGSDPRGWALLSDAHMERGDLAAAISACQAFVNLMPGPEAYVRISHLRWLSGDLAGADEMMRQALDATGRTATETSDWMRVRLGRLRLQVGELDEAWRLADAVLARRADYAPALLLRGQSRLAMDRCAEAVEDLAQAAKLNPLPEYQWWWAESLRENGDPDAARSVEEVLRQTGAERDPRTLALFLATRDQWPGVAERLARDEWVARSDAHTRDAVAWALVAQGQVNEAAEFMAPLLEQAPADGRIWLHAAAIAEMTGKSAEARAYAERAGEFAGGLLPSERRLLAKLLDA